MWTPTDHWLEITIETLWRWEGWLAQGALQGEKYLREIVAASCTLTLPSILFPSFTKYSLTQAVCFMTRRLERGGGFHLADASFNKDWGNLSN